MYGSWIINLLFSIVGFILYAGLSLPNRPITNALIESGIAAVIFYIFAYLLRFLLGYFMKENQIHMVEKNVPKSDNLNHSNASHLQNDILSQLDDEDIEKLSGHIKELMNE